MRICASLLDTGIAYIEYGTFTGIFSRGNIRAAVSAHLFLYHKETEKLLKEGDMKNNIVGILFCTVLMSLPGHASGLVRPIIIDHTCTDIAQIPESWIRVARNTIKLTYGHTSHGSQLVTGMDVLFDSFPTYRFLNDHYYYLEGGGSPAPDTVLSFWDYVPSGDLGAPSWVTWSYRTDSLLANTGGVYAHYPHYRNLVMWSWCGEASWATGGIIDTCYLGHMSQLEAKYPAITFIYMTSHLDGSGAAGNLNLRNEQIRAYCRNNNKVLFDFADIESYDPNGLVNYMPLNCTDACNYDSSGTTVNWAASWIARNPNHELSRLANACGGCAHSERLNCVLKGRAFWWMMGRIAGWDDPQGIADDDIDDDTNSGQLSVIANKKAFEIWPCPVKNLSELKFSRIGEYKIYNALGQIVSAGNGIKPISAKYKTGVYFVREKNSDACRRVMVIE
jgi:hypothetical protein